MKRYLDYYLTNMKIAIMDQFQHRAQNYFYLTGRVIEPVIYLAVWTTIARQQGGSVGGYTVGALAAYYIVWTLVRQMNIGRTPYDWEHTLQDGSFAAHLLWPVSALHFDLSYFAGWKFVSILFWLPVAAILTLIFKPSIHPSGWQVAAFFIAIWAAYVIRQLILIFMGMITFWTTRVTAIFDLIFALELIFSGRLVPMTFMPTWVQRLAFWMPFQWTFYFPIQSLVGNPAPVDLLTGLGMQALWIVAGWLAVRLFWNVSVRRFTSVGN